MKKEVEETKNSKTTAKAKVIENDDKKSKKVKEEKTKKPM